IRARPARSSTAGPARSSRRRTERSRWRRRILGSCGLAGSVRAAPSIRHTVPVERLRDRHARVCKRRVGRAQRSFSRRSLFVTTQNRSAAESEQTPYEAVVVEQLGLVEIGALGADRAARVLLMPWFARDVAITAWARGPEAWLEV